MLIASQHDDDENAQFGLANIPFGVVSTEADPTPKIATRLFDQVFLVPDLIANGLLNGLKQNTQSSLLQLTLNHFASLGRSEHRLVRKSLQEILDDGHAGLGGKVAACAVNISKVRYHLPVTVGDFSDFSCSRDHVLNASEAVMGVRAMPPGFLHFPVGYGGRCSSILPPGTSVRRPLGQFRSSEGVSFGPSNAVDFELEVAVVVGKPSVFGEPVNINKAEEHIFGFLLLNDWSARDIQGLEMNPLGPFNGKSFGTSISPWVVTMDALEPFRTTSPIKEVAPAKYLQDPHTQSHYSIQLKAEIEVDETRAVVCDSRFEWLYWTVREMIAHQTINGCSLNAGDILATGTVSGSTPGSHGCLLEITKGGKESVALEQGIIRKYLEDGDVVRLTGCAGTPGTSDFIGFGTCHGKICESIRID